jgi:hypothetical protein
MVLMVDLRRVVWKENSSRSPRSSSSGHHGRGRVHWVSLLLLLLLLLQFMLLLLTPQRLRLKLHSRALQELLHSLLLDCKHGVGGGGDRRCCVERERERERGILESPAFRWLRLKEIDDKTKVFFDTIEGVRRGSIKNPFLSVGLWFYE